MSDALSQALSVEYATIYGYGIVSAHSRSDVNDLVSQSIAQHRARREAVIEMLTSRSITPPVPAAGYQLPEPVNDPDDAVNLAVRMEQDTATAWRVVLEQTPAGSEGNADRAFAVDALSQAAVLAARWRRVLGVWPQTQAFPGGTE